MGKRPSNADEGTCLTWEALGYRLNGVGLVRELITDKHRDGTVMLD